MKIQEIYQSIHGELPWIGKPCTILRFAGCNLECPYCDAPKEEGTEFPIASLVEACKMAGNDHVLLTGGEPMMQQELDSLIKALRINHYVIVETNGTLPLSPYANCNVMDVKLFKDSWDQEIKNLQSLRPMDALKFVYSNEDELLKAFGFVTSRCRNAPYMVIFSPVNLKENFMQRVIDLQRKMGDVDIRMQVQIHKVLEVG